jgi:hypothetical protein
MDYLLEKGECNRFDEYQMDALEKFCFTLYENTELDKSAERIAELEGEIFKQSQESKEAVSRAIEIILEKDERIAELEKELSLTKDIIVAHQIADETGYIDGVGWVENWSEMEEKVSNLLETHNLEQHSLAANKFANKFCGDATTNYQVQLTIDAHCWCEMLDSKAAETGNLK